METISSVLTRLKQPQQKQRLVENWAEHVPSGSRWRPGDVGDPHCATCKGLGYVRLDLPVGHPDFGRLFACDCAAQRLEAAQAARLSAASALEPEDLGLTWTSVGRTPALAPAVDAVRETLDRGWGWVYLWGPPGPGKTLVLKTAIAECLRRHQGAVFVNWFDLLDHLRAGYSKGDYDERLTLWRTAPVLAVDEFGRAKESEWVREAQGKVFTPRYESALRRRSITLFGSNFEPDKAEDWFADRLADGRFKIVQVGGPSMRPYMEAE
jgi:DNA replication protein DnaC